MNEIECAVSHIFYQLYIQNIKINQHTNSQLSNGIN